MRACASGPRQANRGRRRLGRQRGARAFPVVSSTLRAACTHLPIPHVGVDHSEQKQHRREGAPHALEPKIRYIWERAVDVLADRRAEVEMREPRLPRIVPVEAQRVNPWRRHRRFGRRRRIPLAAGTVCRPAPVRRDEVPLAEISVGAARRGEGGRVELERCRRREEAEVELPSALAERGRLTRQ